MDLVSNDATLWQERLASGTITSHQLVAMCYEQITRHNTSGMSLRAVLNTAPEQDCLDRASRLDEERAQGKLRSALHGVPIIIKDVFPTEAALGMPTTAGACGLATAVAMHNCLLAQRLVDAGLIILGKANLTEFCGLKTVMRLGWSALGGQTRSPYVLGGVQEDDTGCGNSLPTGSSSGSASGVAAGFAPLSIGTETSGSLVLPANRAALFGLKVTSKLAPKQGAFGLSKTYDSLGGLAKSATDLRLLTSIILDDNLPMLSDGDVAKLRVGFVEMRKWQLPDLFCKLKDEIRDQLAANTVQLASRRSEQCGIHVVTDVSVPEVDMLEFEGESIIHSVAFSEFKGVFQDFASVLTNTTIRTLDDLVAYNEANARTAMPPPHTKQEQLLDANTRATPIERLQRMIDHGSEITKTIGLDKAMQDAQVDLIIGPGDSLLYCHASVAGWPIGTIPQSTIAYETGRERPEGLCVIGRAGSEAQILALMRAVEKVSDKRPLPAALLSHT